MCRWLRGHEIEARDDFQDLGDGTGVSRCRAGEAQMSGLLDNAVVSIELGVQDLGMSDTRRVLSATRSIYAGILLLCKQVLWDASPEGTEGILIYRDFVPKRDGSNIILVPKKRSRTIDRKGIRERFSALGLSIDWTKIDALAHLRNDIEHSFLRETPDRMEDILGAALPSIEQLIVEHIKKEPVDVFSSETWIEMLKNKEVFYRQKIRCTESFKYINWPSSIHPASVDDMLCSYCGSFLVQQVDPKNTKYNSIKLRCMECGEGVPADSVLSLGVSSITVK